MLFLQQLVSFPTLSYPLPWHKCLCLMVCWTVEQIHLKHKAFPSGLFFEPDQFPDLFHLIAIGVFLLVQRRGQSMDMKPMRLGKDGAAFLEIRVGLCQLQRQWLFLLEFHSEHLRFGHTRSSWWNHEFSDLLYCTLMS